MRLEYRKSVSVDNDGNEYDVWHVTCTYKGKRRYVVGTGSRHIVSHLAMSDMCLYEDVGLRNKWTVTWAPDGDLGV